MMPNGNGNGSRHALAAILFMGGLEIAYNAYGSVCSSPQTTELRVGGAEGGGAAESTLWKYVWIANSKTLILTGIASLVARTVWPFVGGIVAAGMMHGLYTYARNKGRRMHAYASATPPLGGRQQSFGWRRDRSTSG